MSDAPLHSGAVHEAGHAVMAHLLRVKVGRIRIDLADPDGAARACIEPTNAENRIRIAAAGDACLRAFGIVTALRQGALMDEVEIDNALSELPRPPTAGGRDGSEITVVRVTRICLRSAKY